MALKVGNVIYRSLEEQVRANMQNIDGLSKQFDEFLEMEIPKREKIDISILDTETNGTITAEQLSKLQENDENYICATILPYLEKEFFIPSENSEYAGSLTYVNVGINNGVQFIKTLTITISTLAFTIVKQEIGGGIDLENYQEVEIPFNSNPFPGQLVYYSSDIPINFKNSICSLIFRLDEPEKNSESALFAFLGIGLGTSKNINIFLTLGDSGDKAYADIVGDLSSGSTGSIRVSVYGADTIQDLVPNLKLYIRKYL